MTHVAESWNLTQVYGTAPQDYFLERVAPTDESSLLNLLTNKVLPTVISTSNAARAGTPNFVLLNSGSQRFDLLKGPFSECIRGREAHEATLTALRSHFQPRTIK